MRLPQIGTGFLFALVIACGGGTKETSTAPTTGSAATGEKTLYDRIGGKDVITAVVDDFVANVAADTRINAYFANADIPGLKSKLVDQMCEAAQGPCKYEGKDMKTAHISMGVKEADFAALVENLKKSLDKFEVPEKEQTELLAVLGTMKTDVVGPDAPAR